jgi:hypothetical protein
LDRVSDLGGKAEATQDVPAAIRSREELKWKEGKEEALR